MKKMQFMESHLFKKMYVNFWKILYRFVMCIRFVFKWFLLLKTEKEIILHSNLHVSYYKRKRNLINSPSFSFRS